MSSERGSALILALIMLTFLLVLGGALLTSVTLDVAIGDNFRSETQLLYLAESGIDEACRFLRTSASTPSQLLEAAAAADGVLSSSRDLETLLNDTDDIPLLNGGDRTTGKLMLDTLGRPSGRYFVFLRNDSADGIASLSDSNQVLTLLSIAVIGNSRKVLEVTVAKWKFPALPASLVLDGSPVLFTPAISGFGISGIDPTFQGGDRYAIGVLTGIDRSSVLASIPDAAELWYPGIGSATPPPADIGVVDGLLGRRLSTVPGLERIVDEVSALASDVTNPGWNASTTLGNVGNASDFRVVVVNGDCELGTGTGYGILLVRGNLRMSGSFLWNGLILIIGQGTLGWSGAGSGVVAGSVFAARSRDNDRSPANELGTMRVVPGAVTVDLGGSGSRFQLNNPGAASEERTYQKLPFVPIARREY